jgi:hypothetical protein
MGQGEHQRDVDVDARADERLDGGDAGGRGGHFDHHVGAIQCGEETPRLTHRALRIVGQRGADLQADVAVSAAGLLVDRAQQVGGLPDVFEDQRLVDLHHRLACVYQAVQVLVVVGAAGDGLFEDRRVRGDASQPLVDQGLQVARGDERATDVVNPYRLA